MENRFLPLNFQLMSTNFLIGTETIILTPGNNILEKIMASSLVSKNLVLNPYDLLNARYSGNESRVNLSILKFPNMVSEIEMNSLQSGSISAMV